MKTHLLVMHRKESYPGEHAPEVLSVCDEWTMDENPEWWDKEVAMRKRTVGSDASAFAEIVVDLPTDTVMAALYPAPIVPATIVATTPLENP